MKKAIAIFILVSLAVLGCGKTKEAEDPGPKETRTKNAWENAETLKNAIQEQYGYTCETVSADDWEGRNPAYFLDGYTEEGEQYAHVEIAYDKGTNHVIYMEWYFDPENTTAEERKKAACIALRNKDDIKKTAGLVDTDSLPDYEEAELSDCMLYVMTIEEDGYTALDVQFTDIRQ